MKHVISGVRKANTVGFHRPWKLTIALDLLVAALGEFRRGEPIDVQFEIDPDRGLLRIRPRFRTVDAMKPFARVFGNWYKGAASNRTTRYTFSVMNVYRALDLSAEIKQYIPATVEDGLIVADLRKIPLLAERFKAAKKGKTKS